MKPTTIFGIALLTILPLGMIMAQADEPKIIDVVWLKSGSKLSGTILKWELARGMEFRLLTGAEIIITKSEIARVYQDIPFSTEGGWDFRTQVRGVKPYAFKEKGMYHTFSAFLNFSFMGGAGMHYSIGHRFNRLFGVGIGTGVETHDFNATRNIIPVYAEARGFFLPQKISPYYAVKMGYGFALRDEANGTIEAKGGFHFSPELGVRFGAGDVCYYLGMEYKWQKARYTNQFWWDGSGTFTDDIRYRRFEVRTGLVF